MKATFDLITQPWIPCIRNDGTAVELGLRDVIAEAHTLAGIHDESPPVVVSLHRLLLALLHRVYGPESVKDWRELWQAGQFDPGPLDAYFVRWRHRFDLFDAQRPFYQTPDDRVQPKSVSILLPELASGNNATLFSHTTDDMHIVLTPAQAARTLIAALSFGSAGLSGLPQKFTDCTCTRGIIFLAEGATLLETLLLNLPAPSFLPQFGDGSDAPAWEMENAYTPEREIPHGYLDYLTWQNRRILFLPEETPAGPVAARVTVAPGLRMDPDAATTDPMKLYRLDKKRGRLVLRFDQERAVWRDSSSLFRLRSGDVAAPILFHWLQELTERGIIERRHAVRFAALGMAADQAKVNFYRAEHLPLPVSYLTDESLVDLLARSLNAAEQAALALRHATEQLAALILAPDAGPNSRPDRNTIVMLRSHLGAERRYWSQLELPFSRTLVAIPEKMEEAVFEWFDLLRKTAWSAFEDAITALGDNPRAYKAAVRARSLLNVRLAKALYTQEKI